jgi:DNA-damage-inducible protein J
MASKMLQVKVDEDLKAAADELYRDLGMDTSTAVRMFLAASVRQGGLPFRAQRYDAERQAIIAKVNRGLDDVRAGRTQDAFEALSEIRTHYGF